MESPCPDCGYPLYLIAPLTPPKSNFNGMMVAADELVPLDNYRWCANCKTIVGE